MTASLLEAARGIARQIVADRREIHMQPELAYQEQRTAALVASRLAEVGIEARTGVGGTGVVGLIRGAHAGKTVLLRADMDALPIEELASVEFKSQVKGVMHACGHDGHVAMLLGAARLLQQRRGSLIGNVKLMFQPAEEGGAGALRMIEDGLLEDPAVDGAFAQHVSPLYYLGQVAVKAGPAYASTDALNVRILGKGGHASRPQLTADPIVIAAQVITALQTLVAREVDPTQSAVVTIGSLHAGTARNIIADEAQLLGTVRTYSPDVQALLEARIPQLIQGIARAMRGDAVVEYNRSYPPVINHASGADLLREVIAEVAGPQSVVEDEAQMGGEDFAYVLQRVPGAMYRLGVRNPAWEEPRSTHSAIFELDEDALPIGAAVLAGAALRFLAQ